MQYYKAIILQLNINQKKKKKTQNKNNYYVSFLGLL